MKATSTGPLLCESRHLANRPKATLYNMRSLGGDIPEPYAMCGIHANSEKRWYGKVDRITPDVEAMIRARLAKAEAKRAEANRQQSVANEQARAERHAKAWAALSDQYDLALLIEDGYTPGEVRNVAIAVYPAGGNPDRWENPGVWIDSDGPGSPAYVKVRAGQNLSPNEARALGDAIAIATGWVEDSNAPEAEAKPRYWNPDW